MTAFVLPAADADGEEWGRLAVAIPGFAWTMPWASLPDEHGRVWRRNWCPRDSGFGWTQVCGPLRRDRRPTFEAIDPDDPAAAGCFLRLHSDSPGWHWVEVDTQDYGYRLCSWMGRGHEVKRGPLARNPGRACIAAAAALGRWPGGEG